MKTPSHLTILSFIVALALLPAGAAPVRKEAPVKKPALCGQKTSPPPRTAAGGAAPAKAKQEALQKQAPPTAPTPTQAPQAASLTPGAEKAAQAAVYAGAVAQRVSNRRAIAVVTPDAHLLARAYYLLSRADHDYNGH